MIIRCPQCKFTGALREKSSFSADHLLYCPRCQTPMPFAEPEDPTAVSNAEAEYNLNRTTRLTGKHEPRGST